jgi:hypothetical protein
MKEFPVRMMISLKPIDKVFIKYLVKNHEMSGALLIRRSLKQCFPDDWQKVREKYPQLCEPEFEPLDIEDEVDSME